jgi:hypothetical protein
VQEACLDLYYAGSLQQVCHESNSIEMTAIKLTCLAIILVTELGY